MEETLLFEVDIPRESITSIENLTKQSKALREERKKLNLQSEEGKKRAKEINDQLDSNTQIIKENSSALEKQRLNVGNYQGALDKLVPGLGATSSGFTAMKTTALSFIATPIGAVIGALGLALAALTAYFKGSEEGQNNFNKIVKTGTVVLGNLLDIVRDFGGAIFKVFTGDFKGAAEDLRAGFSGIKNIVSETREEISKGLAIESLRAETDVLERQLIVLRATNEARIAELKLKAEDRSLNNTDRQAALNEALRLQNELSDKAVQVSKNRLEIKKEENALSDSTKEDLMEEAVLTAELSRVEKDRNDKSKEIFTKGQQLKQEQLAADKKEAEERSELERQERIRSVEITAETEAQKDLILEANFKKNIKRTDEALSASIKAAQKETEERKKQAQLQALIDAAKLDAVTNIFRQSAQLAKEGTLLAKVLGVASATVDTYRAANLALATYPPPFGQIAAAVNVGVGLANVAKISGITGFAKGGLSGTRIEGHHGIPIQRSNGDNLLATIKTGEVILNERQQAMLGGDRIFRKMGVPGFASGGANFSVNQAAQRSESVSNQRNLLLDAASRMTVKVTVEDINAGLDRVDNINQMVQIV